MIKVTLTRPNENKPFLTTQAESVDLAVHAAMRAYSEELGDHYTAEMVDKLGDSSWRLQPGRQIEHGSVSLNRPIIVEAFE